MSENAQPTAAGQTVGTPSLRAITDTLRAIAQELRKEAGHLEVDARHAEFWSGILPGLTEDADAAFEDGPKDLSTPVGHLLNRVAVTAPKLEVDLTSISDAMWDHLRTLRRTVERRARQRDARTPAR
jgi:hypothetical protein